MAGQLGAWNLLEASSFLTTAAIRNFLLKLSAIAGQVRTRRVTNRMLLRRRLPAAAASLCDC